MVGAAHYMGGESTKLGYIGGGTPPLSPTMGNPGPSLLMVATASWWISILVGKKGMYSYAVPQHSFSVLKQS